MNIQETVTSRYFYPQGKLYFRLFALWYFTLLITAWTILGHTVLGFEQSWTQPVVEVASACAVQWLLESVDAWSKRRRPRYAGGFWAWANFLLPAWIPGLAVAMLIYPNERLCCLRRRAFHCFQGIIPRSGKRRQPTYFQPLQFRHHRDASAVSLDRPGPALSLHRKRRRRLGLGDPRRDPSERDFPARPLYRKIASVPGLARGVFAAGGNPLRSLRHPLASSAYSHDQQGRWQVFAPKGHPLAPALTEQLQTWGGTGVLVCLPAQPHQDAFRLLLSAAHTALERDGTPRYFVLVQHEGIAASFARTLYLEARELTACVVDVPPIEPACAWVLAEVHAAQGYSEAYYDAQGRRSELALHLLDLEETPQVRLGANDVLLISGGGKGIAAECGLELARTFGVKLALIGRSRPETDPDLAHNLARFAACGVVFRYYAADVTDAHAVKQMISAVQAELGEVTAILHGAGVNEPIPLVKLDAETLTRTLAPKLQGLKHLLAAVDPARLRLLISFSSIIGAIGFPGEADYALANAALSRLSEEFQAKYPNCRCLALEWSIWSGVGMGERLGRVDALLHQGISPISSEVGIFWLKRLLCANTPVRVVVSGRLGPKPPLPMVPQLKLPFWRFLENPRLFYPGIELVVEAELYPASDPYLDDHVFQSERLLPAVLGLEAMAQAARAVTGRVEVPAFEDVRFLQPIVVGEAGITLRLAALVRDQDTVEVVLRSSQSGFQRDCFRAICRFSCPQKGTARRAPTPFISLDLKPDLYGNLLFQGGRFQRLAGYLKLEAFACLAEIAAAEATNWFARYLPQKLLLGDPGSRDAAIHAVQSCIPQAQILPIGIERWLPGDLNAPGPWTVEANEHWQRGEVFCYELAVYGANGVLRERFEGLRLRRIGEVAHRSWPLALLAPYLERRVKELTGTSVRLTLGEGKAAMHRALGEAADIFRRPDGKPLALSSKLALSGVEGAVSAAHAAGITTAVAGQEPIACDLETIAERPWRELLGGRYGLAELIARQGQEGFNAAATRVWTAIECLKKGGFSWDTPVLLLNIATSSASKRPTWSATCTTPITCAGRGGCASYSSKSTPQRFWRS